MDPHGTGSEPNAGWPAGTLPADRHLFEHILMQVTDGIVCRDPESRVLFANPEAKRRARRPPEGTPLAEAPAIWGDCYDAAGTLLPLEQWPISRALRGQAVQGVECHRVGPDGRRSVALISATPLSDRHGRRLGAVAITTDITERTEVEERLVRSERLLGAILEHARDPIFACDAAGRFTVVNPAARRFAQGHDTTQLTLDTLAGPWGQVYDLAGQLVPVDAFPLLRALRHGETVDGWEARIVSAAGWERYVLASAAPLRADGDAIAGAVCTFADVTGLKAVEGQLRQALADRETLLREVHHRVKNNLEMLCALFELQAAAITNPEGRAALEESRTRVLAMARLYEHLYRSMASGQVVLGEYLREVVARFQQLPGQPPIVVRVPADPIALDVDRAIACGLIVNELLTNAMKHAFPAGLAGEIGVGLDREPDRLHLRVWDRGRGLPADLRVEASPSLGLRLVTILARKLHADITVDRAGGTAFTLTFGVAGDA